MVQDVEASSKSFEFLHDCLKIGQIGYLSRFQFGLDLDEFITRGMNQTGEQKPQILQHVAAWKHVNKIIKRPVWT